MFPPPDLVGAGAAGKEVQPPLIQRDSKGAIDRGQVRGVGKIWIACREATRTVYRTSA
jgi:hypothetical protein